MLEIIKVREYGENIYNLTPTQLVKMKTRLDSDNVKYSVKEVSDV